MRLGETSSSPAKETTPAGLVIQEPGACEDQSFDCKYQVIDSRLDLEQLRERWYRDPWGRQDTQSVTKAVENHKNLEDALSDGRFSQLRASKVAYYMTQCKGQLRDWDFIVRTPSRRKNRVLQDESVITLTTTPLQGQLDRELDEDGEEEDIAEEDTDRDGSETASVAEFQHQRLQELKAAVSGRVCPTKAAKKPRSRKDELQRKKIRRNEALRCRGYASYTYEEYVKAARRFDMVYGSAESLYRLAEEKKATLRYQTQRVNDQPTTKIEIHGKLIDVEDPTFGMTQPSPEEALTPEERQARDDQYKQLWAQKQREDLTRSLEKQETMQGRGMFG